MSDEEIQVRLTADPSDLAEGFEESAAVAEASQQRMADAATAAAAQIKTAAAVVAETNEQAQARIKAMVSTSLQQAEANKTVELSERALREAEGFRTDATEQQLAAMAAMRAAQDAQMVSTENYFGAEAAATAETIANTDATVANTAAQSALNEKIASGAAVREYSALVDEALSGNFRRMSGTAAVLSNRLGFMSALFSPLGAAAAGAAGLLGVFVAALVKGTEEETRFEQAIQTGGNYLGLTTEQLENMARSMSNGTTSTKETTAALLAAANTGRVTADNIQMVAQAALNMHEVTGVAIAKAVDDFQSLQDKPLQAAVKLNEQYHFLSEATYDQIAAFEKAGLVEQAAAVAQEAFANAFHERVQAMQKDTSDLANLWESLTTSLSNMWTNMKHNLGTNTLGDQIEVIDQRITQLQQNAANTDPSSYAGKWAESQIEALESQKEALQVLQRNQNQAAAVQGDDQQANMMAVQFATEETAAEKHEHKLTEIHDDGISARLAAGAKATRQDISDLDTTASIQESRYNADVSAQERALQQKVSLGEISKQEELASLEQLENQKYAMELQDLNNQIALQPKETEEYNKLLLKKEALLEAHSQKVGELENQMVDAQVQRYRAMLAPVNAAVQASVNGIIQGTTSGRQVLANIGMAVLDEFIARGISMLTNWIAMEAAKTSATTSANATRVTSDTAAATNSVAVAKASAIQNIGAYAAEAAAAAAQSVAAIPFVGWIMAPGVAAATYAETLAYEGAAAASRGWDDVPGATWTLLHPHEMVLSAPIAQGARETFRAAAEGGMGGGGGDEVHHHWNLVDGHGVRDLARRNPHVFGPGRKRATRLTSGRNKG